MSDSDDDSDNEFEDDVQEMVFVRDFDAEANVIAENLLPDKSSKSYALAYDYFMTSKNLNNGKKVNDNMFFVYFEDLSKS